MSNIVFVNLNVGSAIEQTGNLFINWIKEITDNIDVYTHQTKEKYFYQYLLDQKPDVIIVNGEYPRILTPLFFYKLTYPNTKVIFISRVFTDFMLEKNVNKNKHKYYYEDRLEELYKLMDYIFINNTCGLQERMPDWLSDKVVDCCGFNDLDMFNIQIPWENRENKFLLFGSLNPHKLKSEFIDRISQTEVYIDAYGTTNNQPEWFSKKFSDCSNIIYKGQVDFNDVPFLLNQYKYFLLPHDGVEPLNHSLIQSMLCGCIPIVFDNYNNSLEGKYWLRWANGMYLGCDTMDNYIEAIVGLNVEDIKNGNMISETMRNNFISKFDYAKDRIQQIVKNLD